MRKADDGERKKEKKKKRKLFIVATNVVASRPPEPRPTGMPHARAKSMAQKYPTYLLIPLLMYHLIFYSLILRCVSLSKSHYVTHTLTHSVSHIFAFYNFTGTIFHTGHVFQIIPLILSILSIHLLNPSNRSNLPIHPIC